MTTFAKGMSVEKRDELIHELLSFRDHDPGSAKHTADAIDALIQARLDERLALFARGER